MKQINLRKIKIFSIIWYRTYNNYDQNVKGFTGQDGEISGDNWKLYKHRILELNVTEVKKSVDHFDSHSLREN